MLKNHHALSRTSCEHPMSMCVCSTVVIYLWQLSVVAFLRQVKQMDSEYACGSMQQIISIIKSTTVTWYCCFGIIKQIVPAAGRRPGIVRLNSGIVPQFNVTSHEPPPTACFICVLQIYLSKTDAQHTTDSNNHPIMYKTLHNLVKFSYQVHVHGNAPMTGLCLCAIHVYHMMGL